MGEAGKDAVDVLLLDFEEIATPIDLKGSPLAGEEQGRIRVIKDGGIAIKNGKIIDIGRSDDIKRSYKADREFVFEGKTAIPGLVDPHTHLVYGGCRHSEFELRLEGVPYIEILKTGGGINDTVKQTRELSEAELLELARKRLQIAVAHGTTTVEIKSGYGLSYEHELKLLKVINALAMETSVTVVPTFLGAHAIPPEFKDDREGYISLIIDRMLPDFKALAEFVDVFMDEGAFTAEETERILGRASELGYKLKLHADELAPGGGAELAAKLGAVSADHLVKVSENGIKEMAEAGTIAVLLPATTFMLRHRVYAPARKFIEAGVPVALATDHNPGTSPVISQAISMGLATMMMDMSPSEALTAATLNAAYAIGKGRELGSLQTGKLADITVIDAHSYIHTVYEFGRNLTVAVFKKGELIYEA